MAATALTATEARMARAALKLPLRRAAGAARMSSNTVARFEAGGVHHRTAVALEGFYRAAGIRFPGGNVVDAGTTADPGPPDTRPGPDRPPDFPKRVL